MTNSAFIIAHSQYRYLLVHIAKKLSHERGLDMHLYCTTNQEIDFYKNIDTDGVFSSIQVSERRYEAIFLDEPNLEAVTEAAIAREEWLGVTYNELILQDRHLGRGFALGGHRHPRSKIARNATHARVLAGINAEVDFWRSEFEAKSPSFVIWGNKIVATIAHKLNIPYRSLTSSRYGSLFYWSGNEFGENPLIEQEYLALEKQDKYAEHPGNQGDTIESPYRGHLVWRDKFLKHGRASTLVKTSLTTCAKHAYWKVRGFDKGKVGYPVLDELGVIYRSWRDFRKLTHDHPTLNQIRGKKFVFFPLHTEPEVALTRYSPEYFFQLSAIASIARDLPADTLLVVKETFFALGRRPRDFYSQIKEFNNVVFLELMEFGLDIVRDSAAVVTITGTAGLEAATMGKPVLTFGRHNTYNFLPHVHVIADEADLKDPLHRILRGDFDARQAEKDGLRFLAAVKRVSFDLGSYNITTPDQVPQESIENSYSALVRHI